MGATGVFSRPSLASASSLLTADLTPGSASLHPGLYAVARVRELVRPGGSTPGSRQWLYAVARVRELVRPEGSTPGSHLWLYAIARIRELKTAAKLIAKILFDYDIKFEISNLKSWRRIK